MENNNSDFEIKLNQVQIDTLQSMIGKNKAMISELLLEVDAENENISTNDQFHFSMMTAYAARVNSCIRMITEFEMLNAQLMITLQGIQLKNKELMQKFSDEQMRNLA